MTRHVRNFLAMYGRAGGGDELHVELSMLWLCLPYSCRWYKLCWESDDEIQIQNGSLTKGVVAESQISGMFGVVLSRLGKVFQVLYTDDPKLPQDQWQIARAGSPEARSLRVANLKEKTDYTFRLRAYNELGPGLPSDTFTLTTWLAARPPVVSIRPADRIVKDPSNDELVFECEAIGVPKPKILWLWSGGLVEDGKVSFWFVFI
ncbi:unnamed protein product [Gongylonema pulchrum]|uniref:Fibronectin type-III domain-containing protein n=1 Tax=Gongylonema pulchrum TaxID=637853 RepID=A0A183EVC2_9BILA|nr:unnamed protein product [Gongylonema pulchrum]